MRCTHTPTRMRRLSGLESHLKRRRSSVMMSTEGMSSNVAPELAIHSLSLSLSLSLCLCVHSTKWLVQLAGLVGYIVLLWRSLLLGRTDVKRLCSSFKYGGQLVFICIALLWFGGWCYSISKSLQFCVRSLESLCGVGDLDFVYATFIFVFFFSGSVWIAHILLKSKIEN